MDFKIASSGFSNFLHRSMKDKRKFEHRSIVTLLASKEKVEDHYNTSLETPIQLSIELNLKHYRYN